jgi:hypothetical protein
VVVFGFYPLHGYIHQPYVPLLVDELIEPLIVGRTQERICIRPKVHRMLRAQVDLECLQVGESLDELKVVRGRRLAEQGERLDLGIVEAVVHECIKQRPGLAHELGVDIHVRDDKNLTGLRVLTARIHAYRSTCPYT